MSGYEDRRMQVIEDVYGEDRPGAADIRGGCASQQSSAHLQRGARAALAYSWCRVDGGSGGNVPPPAAGDCAES